MMRHLVTVTIEGPSHNDVENAKLAIVKACQEVRDRMNNGSRIQVSSADANDINATLRRVKLVDWLRGEIVPDTSEKHRKVPRQTDAPPKSIDELLLDI